MAMIPEFDKLFAVSDLHLGGKPDRHAFRETAGLQWLIDQAATDSAKRVALLLNGDIVDFLAEGLNAKEFNLSPEGILRRTAADPDFNPIFVALRNFVSLSERVLVLQLGNHDIELALPGAYNLLLELLGVQADAARKRLLVETSGAGWTCRVGSRIVLALHGNASDPWNEVDYAALGRVARALEAGQPPDSLPPTNAGTTLVIHVLNAIKETFPFVDLLKPEGAPLMAVLKAVNAQESTRGLLRALRIRASKGHLFELLGAEEDHPNAVAEAPAGQMLAFLSSVELPTAQPREALRRAEFAFSQGITPRALVSDGGENLGAAVDFGRVQLQRLEAAVGRLADRPDEFALREALRDWLAEDESFDIQAMSSIDRRIARSASHGVHVLLAGHTHLPREASDGPTTYINTGTWMRTLKLKGSSYLENGPAFASFMAAVRAGTLEALDNLNIDPRARPVAVVDAFAARLHSVREVAGKFELKLMLEAG